MSAGVETDSKSISIYIYIYIIVDLRGLSDPVSRPHFYTAKNSLSYYRITVNALEHV